VDEKHHQPAGALMAGERRYTIGELFMPDEIALAMQMYLKLPDHQFARACADQVVTPALPRIEQYTGQKNDALFLAYMIQHVFNLDKKQRTQGR
jgi:hypothetical protein